MKQTEVSIDQLHKAKLATITSPNQLLDYIAKTSDILEDYYNGNCQKDLHHEYLMLTDINYRIKHSVDPMNIDCDNCNTTRLYIPEEGRYVCTSCGETEYILTNLATYSDKPYFKKFIPYIKINYLKERLKHIQSKEAKTIPESIILLIKANLSSEQCTIKQIRNIMKQHKLQKYYKNMHQIYCAVTGSQPIRISQKTEQQIIHMFKQIEPIYIKLCPNRGKFLKYSYVLNKLFHILNMSDVASHFPLLKNKRQLSQHDSIFRQICEQLHWEFPT